MRRASSSPKQDSRLAQLPLEGTLVMARDHEAPIAFLEYLQYGERAKFAR